MGELALTGRFPGADGSDTPIGPITLVRCEQCGLAQLGHDYDPDELYRHEYGYRSGINSTMSKHLNRLVADVTGRRRLEAGDVVLDIGSNDGTLLHAYHTPEIQRVGMDPTIDQYRNFYEPDIVAVADYFSASGFARVSRGRAKIITSIAMFYDLADPSAFVADIAASLASDGLWVLELCYAKRMIELNAFDTVCHEHAAYYCLDQLVRLFEVHGLRVFDVSFSDVNGGSFRVFVCHRSAPFVGSDEVTATLTAETAFGLDTAAPYEAFRSRVEAQKGKLRELIDSLKRQGKTVYGYGASTKGNVLLQYCGFDATDLVAVADRNPAKWGRWTPGTCIPIISEYDARAQRPDYMLVLPWHFRDEFIEREADFLSGGGHMIFPLPNLEIV